MLMIDASHANAGPVHAVLLVQVGASGAQDQDCAVSLEELLEGPAVPRHWREPEAVRDETRLRRVPAGRRRYGRPLAARGA